MTEETQSQQTTTTADNANTETTTTQNQDNKQSTTQASEAAQATDWRKELAGDDEKEYKRLERFASAADLWKSYKAADSKIGELTSKVTPELPKDATPEQVKEWRAKVGIPDSPDGYKLNVTIPEQDKPLVNAFLSKAISQNMTPAVAQQALSAYYEMEKELTLQTAQEIAELTSQHEESLRAEWGGDYKANMTINKNYLSTLVEPDVVDAIIGGVAADGTPLKTHPAFNKLIQAAARSAGMIDSRAYDDGQGVNQIDARMKEIAEIRKNDFRRYTKEGLDKELAELYKTKDKYTKK